MNVHEFIKIIVENKDLYSEEDYNNLLNEAKIEYDKYLKNKYFK